MIGHVRPFAVPPHLTYQPPVAIDPFLCSIRVRDRLSVTLAAHGLDRGLRPSGLDTAAAAAQDIPRGRHLIVRYLRDKHDPAVVDVALDCARFAGGDSRRDERSGDASDCGSHHGPGKGAEHRAGD
jgi:hypothetical protein